MSPAASWGKIVVTGDEIDADTVRRAASIFFDPVHAVELRGLPSGRSFVREGNNLDAILDCVKRLASDRGVYWCLNPVSILPGADRAARVGDVVLRRWLLVDFDPIRPADANATAEEKDAAFALAGEVMDWLTSRGWPLPVVVDSGNGWHLLYRVDLPNDADSRDLIKAILAALGDRFDTAQVEVDRVVFNAARLSKLPGTVARKGPHSSERPHRRASLWHVPDTVEVVSRSQIESAITEPGQASAETVAEDTPPQKRSWGILYATTSALDAIDRACRYAESCTPAVSGSSGHARTMSVARGVVWGFALSVEDGVRVLLSHYNARCSPPWTEKELLHKCEDADRTPDPSGRPRGYLYLEGKAEQQASSTPPPIGDEDAVTIPGHLITPRKVEWLWPGRIPLGKLTTFAGIGGLGKTFVLCDITARVTRGMDWPDGSGKSRVGRVLFVSGEDDPDDTLVPRMMEMDADLKRVRFLRTEVLDTFTLRDLKTLDRAMAELSGEAVLVVIDPPTAYLGGADDHKNAELRGLLSPLKNWAARHKTALVFNTHVNKGTGQKVEAMMRVMGSVAWVNAVRTAHLFARDPEDDDRRFFVGMKNNVGKEKKGLAYRIIDTPVLARIEWLGEVDVSADQAINRAPGKPRKVVASDWLVERFREQLEWSSDELFRAAKEEGISRDAMFEAKNRLGIPKARRTVRPNGEIVWVWWVAADWAPLRKEEQASNEAVF